MSDPRSSFEGYGWSDPSASPNLLDHYFASVYSKLEADSMVFNRRLPHAGVVGTENEGALADLIRAFLPPRFGVDTGIVIDRLGRQSRQCDIVIYDHVSFPKYLRRVFPVELVYGVIEVKTAITSTEAKSAAENLRALFELEFRPALTNYWITRSEEDSLFADPPFGMVFAYRANVETFESFARWFPWSLVHSGVRLRMEPPNREIRSFVAVALDKGLIRMESSNGYVTRWVPVAATPSPQSCSVRVGGEDVLVDPAKSLLLFLETLWQRVSQHRIHPGFDIRSYMSEPMNSIQVIDDIGPEASNDEESE